MRPEQFHNPNFSWHTFKLISVFPEHRLSILELDINIYQYIKIHSIELC